MAAKGKGSNVGNVYVTVVPTMRGFAKEMNRQLSGINVTQTGRKIGETLGGSIVTSLSDKLVSGGNALQGFGRSVADVGGKLTTGLTLPLATATAGVGAFALSTASAAETTEISFTTMLGSAEAARDMMDELADFAAHTPFELSGLQTATRQLLAYGFTAEDVVPMLTAVGDATAALGTGQQGIEAVTRALGQMQTRGKVSAEEMLQLTEQGIPAWEYLAEAIGTDTAGAMEKVTDGAVSASEGIRAVTEGMERDFGGMMEEQSKTIEGLASNLTDALTQPFMELKDSEAYASLADGLERVVDAAGPFVESLLPHMERGLVVVADVLDGAADAMESFSDMSEEGQSQLVGLVAQAALAGPALTVLGRGIQGVGTLMRGAGGAVKAGTTLVGKLSDGLLDLATSPKTAETALGKFAGVVSSIPTPVTIAAGVIGTVLVGAFADWAAKAEEARKEQQLLDDATMSAAEIMGDASSSAEDMGDAIGSIEPDVEGTLESLKSLNESVRDTFSDQYVDEAKLDQYVSVIDDLANKSDLSATQQWRLKEAVDGYNDVVGTQYSVIDAVNGKIADQDGVIQENTDQINANAEAWRQRARAEAYQSVATQYMEEEAKASYELSVAQDNLATATDAYADAKERYNAALESGDSVEIARTATAMNEAEGAMNEAADEVDRLSAAYETASDNAKQFADWAAIEASDASEATKESAKQISSSLGEMGDAFRSSMEGMGYDVNDLTLKLAEAGVATAELDAIGSGHIRSLAESCEGDVDRMVWAIDNYNNVPIVEKDGTVRIEDSQLIDSQGRVYTWNGTALVDQDGNVAVQDQELIDAQGRIYVWNGSSLVWQSTGVSVDTGEMDSAWSKWETMDFAWKRTGVTAGVYINNVPGVMATGGVIPHADGFIATGPTMIGGNHLIGEAGAEAYFGLGGSSYVVPLTNRRYSQPFVDLVAEGVARKSDSAEVVAAINALRDELSQLGVYLDSGKLVGGITPQMNRSLGRVQRRGSLA